MRRLCTLILLGVVLSACSGPAPIAAPQTPTVPQPTASPSPLPATQAPSPTAPSASPTPDADAAQSEAFNPLTGLIVTDPTRLDRRPMAIKIENLPRGNRPQYGVSAADLVYEYYTEQGTTRFTAVFYGSDAERVAPIRSGRFFDANVIQMYKAVFAFGSAYEAVLQRFYASDFADRMVIEGGQNNCPPMCRIDPNGRNLLYTNTQELSEFFTQQGIDNTRQDLTGMTFDAKKPQGGKPAPQVFVRFSSAIYNRWDYDSASGRYLRWVDKQDAGSEQSEVYVQLMDKENNQPIAADNVVIVYVDHEYIAKTAEIEVFDMNLLGTGNAFAIRDGQIYTVKWQRQSTNQVLSLMDADGTPFALKPGTTWFEVLSLQSKHDQNSDAWRFQFVRP